MSYAQFLLLFVCIPLAVLAWSLRDQLSRVDLGMLGRLAAVAVAYTTPWDNYLVATGVWFYNPHLVLNHTLGYVPVEEYAFFVLQVFLCGLFGAWLWRRFYHADGR